MAMERGITREPREGYKPVKLTKQQLRKPRAMSPTDRRRQRLAKRPVPPQRGGPMAKMPVPIAGGSRTYPIGGGGEAPTVDTAAATGPYQHGQTAGSQMRRGGTPAPTGPTPVMPSLTTGLQEAMDKGTYDPREGDEPAAQPAGEPARQPYSTLARAARKPIPDNTDKAMAMANEKGGQWQHWKKILDKISPDINLQKMMY